MDCGPCNQTKAEKYRGSFLPRLIIPLKYQKVLKTQAAAEAGSGTSAIV